VFAVRAYGANKDTTPAPLRVPVTLSPPEIALLPVMAAPPPVTVKPLGKDSEDVSEVVVT